MRLTHRKRTSRQLAAGRRRIRLSRETPVVEEWPDPELKVPPIRGSGDVLRVNVHVEKNIILFPRNPPVPSPTFPFASYTNLAMGLLADLSDYVARTSNGSLALTLAGGFAASVLIAITLNVLRQLLLKNPNEPPVVFHWVPFFGSTIVYGIDPYKFFFNCREKVRKPPEASPAEH